MLTLLVNLTGYKENKNKKHISVLPPVRNEAETGLLFSTSDAMESALTFLTF